MDSLFQINQFDFILFKQGISGDYSVLTGRSAYYSGTGQWGSCFEMGKPFQTFKSTYVGGCWHHQDARLTRVSQAKMSERSLFPFSISGGEEDRLEGGKDSIDFCGVA